MTEDDRLADLRRDYRRAALDEGDADADPLALFSRWLADARTAKLPEPNAMTLATADAGGAPDARVVLLKDLDEHGLVFYSNYVSAKGRQLDANPRAALVFLWLDLERQVRIDGRVEKVSRAQSEAYFHSRPRGSQLGALASHQSAVVAGREPLERRYADADARYQDAAVPLPEQWGGYRVVPNAYEFWQGRSSRLHDRLRYHRGDGDAWLIERLEP